MAFPATRISNNILKRAFEENIPVTPMKLQKILFFLAAEYGKTSREKYLFDQMFQPWRYGPVLPSIYDEFRQYGNKKITKYAKDANGKSTIVDETQNPALTSVLNRVWAATKNHDAIELSQITHARDSAWYKAWMEQARYISEDSVIEDHTYEPLLQIR